MLNHDGHDSSDDEYSIMHQEDEDYDERRENIDKKKKMGEDSN